ncbi:MAG: hypothetical protein FWE14_00075 [Lachnospiraceae bacterium]|nr:hypothetical protein [Lachnospiraceae bacterium]
MEYNARLYNYSSGQHLTFYKKTITKNENVKKEKPEKTYQKSRTKEQEERSKKSSMSRTKNKIYQISRSNHWDWFITLTFDRTKTDASDYEIVVRKLQKFLENIRYRKCPNLKYLIVPELHADKTHYHFHGLLSDCPELSFIYSGKDDKSENPIYNIANWKLGFTTATKVKDNNKVSAYITKYITKENGEHYLKGKRRYYSSKNIDVAEPEYLVIDNEEFQSIYADQITHMKTQNISQAHQQITYYELKY